MKIVLKCFSWTFITVLAIA